VFYIENDAFILFRRRGLPQLPMHSWNDVMIAADLLVRF